MQMGKFMRVCDGLVVAKMPAREREEDVFFLALCLHFLKSLVVNCRLSCKYLPSTSRMAEVSWRRATIASSLLGGNL